MEKSICILLLLNAFVFQVFSQKPGVGIGTAEPNPNAILHLVAPGNNQGFLLPRLTTAQRTAEAFLNTLTSNDNGLIVYDSDENAIYFWVNDIWIKANSQSENLLLNLQGTKLSLSNGNTVDLSVLQDGIDDADADPGNELNTTLGFTSNVLSLTDAGGTLSADLSSLVGTDDQDLSLDGANHQLSLTNDATAVDLSPYLDNTDNQNLRFDAGNLLSISGGNQVDLSLLENTDAQQLTLAGNDLALENGGIVNLSGYLDNTDSQNLALSGTVLGIDNGNTVDLSILQDGVDDADADPGNELNTTLNFTSNVLSITDAGGTLSADLSSLVGTDDQDLSLDGATHQLSLTNDATAVDLSPYLDNTDSQNLALTGTVLGIDNGNTVDLSILQDGVDDADADPGNELNTTLGFTSNVLSITDAGGTLSADLSSLVGTDDQDLSFDGANHQLSLTNDATAVDLSLYMDNTDSQTLSLDLSNTLSISGGNQVDLSLLENTDAQQLTLAGNDLALENGGTVNLSGYLDNTDSQNLTLSGTILGIDSGNTVDLSVIQDGVDDADADPANEWQTASQVSVTPAGNLTSTDVQMALEELQNELDTADAVSIQGNPVSALTPAQDEVLKWNGTEWVPGPDNSSTVNSVTSYYSIHPSSFIQSAKGVNTSSEIRYQAEGEYTYLHDNAGTNLPGAIMAPINLPHGATVKSYKIYLADSDPATDITVKFYKKFHSTNSYDNIGQGTSAGISSSGVLEFNAPTTNKSIIDNLDASYYVWIEITKYDSINTKQQINSIIITYTTP